MITIFENAIKLPKVRKVKAMIHRKYEDWKIKSATVSQDCDGKYYVSVLYEFELETVPLRINVENAIEVKKTNNHGSMVAESKRMNNQRFPNKKFRRFINSCIWE